MHSFLKSKNEIEFFDQNHLTSTDDVDKAICKTITEAEHSLFGSPQDIALKKIKIDLLTRFYQSLKNHVLFDFSGTAWCYWIRITCNGIELHMGHCYMLSIVEDTITSTAYDSDYCILKTESRMLTLEEYAQIVNVKAPTLRQWIKRGKLRTAVKYGDEWRVPEYTPLPLYGYTSATYFIKEGASVSFPDKYQYLSDVDFFTIYQDENKTNFHLSTGPSTCIHDLSSEEREELEMFCQLNPDIEYKTPMSETIYNY